MRRIVMFNHVTADGYFAALDGGLDWVTPDDEMDRAAVEGLSGADTILLGRRTYEMFEQFWPHAVDNPETGPDPHGPGRSPELRAIAIWINNATKLVISRTRRDVTWKNSRILREFDAHEIEQLKEQPGKDIMVFGSGSIVSQLAQHGLIDEYQLVVAPILLGGGKPLFTSLQNNVALSLVEARAYPSNNVMLRYERAATSA